MAAPKSHAGWRQVAALLSRVARDYPLLTAAIGLVICIQAALTFYSRIALGALVDALPEASASGDPLPRLWPPLLVFTAAMTVSLTLPSWLRAASENLAARIDTRTRSDALEAMTAPP